MKITVRDRSNRDREDPIDRRTRDREKELPSLLSLMTRDPRDKSGSSDKSRERDRERDRGGRGRGERVATLDRPLLDRGGSDRRGYGLDIDRGPPDDRNDRDRERDRDRDRERDRERERSDRDRDVHPDRDYAPRNRDSDSRRVPPADDGGYEPRRGKIK